MDQAPDTFAEPPPGLTYTAVLGEGAFGKVFRAREQSSNRDVAVKVVTGASERALKRFQREGQVLASLQHPGIVRVFSQGQHRGNPYLVLELVEGGRTLDHSFAQASAPTRVGLVLEVARAVAHAHAAGIVHRDLKPANVLVDGAGRPKVCDFGLASARDVERLTRTGSVMGTPQYMSPEQIGGQGHGAGPTADVWALGVLLYQALTGTLPFDGRTMVELASQIARAKPPPLRSHDPTLPAAFEPVVKRALTLDPAQRYPSAAEFAAALEGVGRSAWSESASPRPWVWVAVGLACLALLGATAWGLSRAFREGPAAPAAVGERSGPSVDELRALLGEEEFEAVLAATAETPLSDRPRSILRGWALRRLEGASPAAVELCQRLLERYPDDAEVNLLCGQTITEPESDGTNPRMRELLERAVELEPEHPYALLALAGALLVDEPERARELYERSVRLEPNVEHPFMTYRSRGILAGHLGLHRQVLEHLRLARRWRPDDTELLCLISDSQFALNDLQGALDSCRRAMRGSPPELRAFQIAVEVYKKLEQPLKVVEVCHEALEALPNSAWAHYELGYLFLYAEHDALPPELGEQRYDLSVEHLEACLESDPDPRTQQLAKDFLYDARNLKALSEIDEQD